MVKMETTSIKKKTSALRPLDLRQSKEYGAFLTDIGWEVIGEPGRQMFLKKIPIIGSALKVQRANIIDWELIKETQRKNRVFMTIIEPQDTTYVVDIKDHGYKTSNSPYLPTKTSILDISKSEDQILSSFKKDTRQSVRRTSDMDIYEETSIEKFRSAWALETKGARHVLPLNHLEALKRAFGKNFIILMAKDSSAGGVFISMNGTTSYWIGFTGDKARKTLAQYQIIWRGILWGKSRKSKHFDFEGIYDERFPKKDWIGFSHFKRSFGGAEVLYPGCFIRYSFPFSVQN